MSASRAWRWTALVAHFDGSCHRADAGGGAGSLCGNSLGMTTRSLPKRHPLPGCPDSDHAEGFASAYAVQALASLHPNHSDAQECLIIGDNFSILSYWRRTTQVRRPALVTVLHQAQLIAATELLRISWRYVPREPKRIARWFSKRSEAMLNVQRISGCGRMLLSTIIGGTEEPIMLQMRLSNVTTRRS